MLIKESRFTCRLLFERALWTWQGSEPGAGIVLGPSLIGRLLLVIEPCLFRREARFRLDEGPNLCVFSQDPVTQIVVFWVE